MDPHHLSFCSRPARALLTAGFLLISATPAAPGAPAVAPQAYRQEVEQWRVDRTKGLKNPDGWLTLVGLLWLKEGENRFGTAADNELVFPAAAVGETPARAGSFRLEKGTVTLRVEPGAAVTHEGKPVKEMTVAPDATGKPTMLELGSLSFHVIKRGEKLGVRLRDRQSPALAAFHGVESFPVDPSWRVEARFERYDPPKPVPVPNVLGTVEEQPSPGAVVFEHGGRTHRLDALPGSDKGDLFLIFADPTNGEETYGAGRFLSTPPPADGRVVVDFNKAYNPPCAFTAYATCPLPPRQNRLAVRVEAGEKSYAGAAH